MQIFANGKRRFLSFVEFYVTNLKIQRVKIWSKYHCKDVRANCFFASLRRKNAGKSKPHVMLEGAC